MRLFFISCTLMAVIAFSCNVKTSSQQPDGKFVQLILVEDNLTPTVDIRNCILITNNAGIDSVEAREIMKVKRNLPLAMQAHDSSLFERILAPDFTFRAENEFFNRADYIKDRSHATWTIDTVKFQHLVLQFFNGTALLTYTNVLNGTDDTGRANLEYYSWADIYVKENGSWKIGGIHQIEARVEYK